MVSISYDLSTDNGKIVRRDKGSIRVVDKKPKRKYYDTRDRRFIAWDGEGYTDETGEHHYSLFGNSEGHHAWISKGSSTDIDWRVAFRMLCEAPQDAIHVIYSGVYDFVMMIKSLPEEIRVRLLHSERTYIGQYNVQYFRGKWLSIKDRTSGVRVVLYDVFSFFGCSFVKACREYLPETYKDTLDQIEQMKLKRATFTEIGTTEQAYMKQELDMLVMLAETLRARLAAVDIHPAKWHGPGAIASTVLRSWRISEARGNYSERFRRNAENAYYGGRFQQFKRGTYEGTVYEYDIRSAYPSAMVHLPDLSEVKWFNTKRIDNNAPINKYALYRIDNSKHDTGNVHGNHPWRRSDGSIFYPRWTNGWYWGIEVPQELAWCVKEMWEPYGDGLHARPFARVQNMYDDRRDLKAAGRPEQLAYKLALNSFYGKLAQSKGARRDAITGEWRLPSFHEPVWAGWITAYARSRINAIIQQYPNAVIAAETDAVFTTEPLKLDLGTGLGQWEEQTFDGIMYIQSGVYYIKSGDTWKIKSRGFSPKDHTPELWMDYLSKLPSESEVGLSVRHHRFGTVPNQRSNWARWYATDHRLIVDNKNSKMVHDKRYCDCQGSYADGLHTLSIPPVYPEKSKAYPFPWTDPKGAAELEESYEMPDLIDYAEMVET